VFAKVNPSSQNRLGHYYDLSKVMDEKKLENIKVQTFDASQEVIDTPRDSR